MDLVKKTTIFVNDNLANQVLETASHPVDVLNALEGELDVFVVLAVFVPFAASLKGKQMMNLFVKLKQKEYN